MVIKGRYIKGGCGHFKTLRPKFYAEVERHTGLKLRHGTLNIRCEPEVFVTIPEPSVRIEGVDQIDIGANPDLLIGPCSIIGIQGFRILPVVRPNTRAGHDSEGIIEVSLVEWLDMSDRAELEITFPDEGE